MVWKARGAERGKSYAVYKELERQYKVLQRRYDEIEAELQRKNSVIRAMAKELSEYAKQLAPGDMSVAEIAAHLVTATEEAPSWPLEAPQVPHPPKSDVAYRGPVKVGVKGSETLQQALDRVSGKGKG